MHYSHNSARPGPRSAKGRLLEHLRRKELAFGEQRVIVQVNPARRRSVLAKTDAKAVAGRACFLCPENMPAEERGVAFDDLVVLPNPFPILPLHVTIAGREHRPQSLASRVGTFLELAKELGPDMAALYNGPQCGASAPDHFHFQAASAEGIPILSQLPETASDRLVTSHASFGRNMLIFSGVDANDVQAGIERSIDMLRDDRSTADEPMLNLIARFRAGRYTAVLFARAAHRPACFFSAGADQLAISPAVLEMGGILVTTELEHFDRVTTEVARAIYEEVSIGSAQFAQLVG